MNVVSGTGEKAQTGSDDAWGKTGTTDNNGDAWFCGGTEHLTACVWVGHAQSNEPMETEYGGQPVDGGTFPAIIWSQVMQACEAIYDQRAAGEDDVSSSSGGGSTEVVGPAIRGGKVRGDLIHMKVVQKALHALGHYDGPIDGGLSIVTRASIRKFQREMEFDETDTLTPMQTVYLLCNAGETARDLASQNALGIMYATGLGVEQNIDIALEWLRTASQRGYADATFNLSVLYGSGVVFCKTNRDNSSFALAPASIVPTVQVWW